MKGPLVDEEFEAFFLENFPRLTRALASMTDAHLAEDVAQETMLIIRAKWGRYERPELAMYKIGRREASRLIQRHRRVVPVQPQPLNVALSQRDERASFTPRSEDEKGLALGIDVRNALAKLPERQREVIVLSIICDLAGEDVAEVLGITESAVKTHKSRGLKRLERLLGDRLLSAAPQAEQRVGGSWSD